MNWKQLAKEINEMTDEQQETDVTILLATSNEFYPLSAGMCFNTPNEDNFDVLDENHPYLMIDA